MKKIITSIFCSASLFLSVQAQQPVPCLTDHVQQELHLQFPELKAYEEQVELSLLDKVNSLLQDEQTLKKAGNIKYIPVVFHIIHNDGMENITQAQLMDQLRVLNEDFRKKAGTLGGASTNSLAVDMEMEFRLAQRDPNGNRHDGINRVKSTLTTDARNNVKGLIQWDPRKYLNIWIVQSINNSSGSGEGTVLGFAQFPSSINLSPSTDGIVMRADYTGTIITGNIQNAGRTLTHEVGHWIGLFHTFQDGCVGGTTSNCAIQGDRVCDTPPAGEANFGCKADTYNSCSNDSPDLPDQIRNYMDYSDGNCTNLFTVGQKARALAQMQQFRSLIYSDANVTAAGIDPETGNYLSVPASSIKAPYSYGFEDATIANAGWRIQNLNNGALGWGSSTVAFSGNRSVALMNFNNGSAVLNSRDEFNSPLIDLSTLTSPNLSFKLAYARKASNTNDVFVVTISGDFGRTETQLFLGSISTLETAPITSTSFSPNGPSEWRTVSIDLTPYRQMTNARVRFEFRNRRGNNIYIDDFSITQATGVNEALAQSFGVNVFPNPMQEQTKLQFNVSEKQKMSINLYDLSGKKVRTIIEGDIEAGVQELVMNNEGLVSGLYLIRFETTKGSFSKKLLVNGIN